MERRSASTADSFMKSTRIAIFMSVIVPSALKVARRTTVPITLFSCASGVITAVCLRIHVHGL